MSVQVQVTEINEQKMQFTVMANNNGQLLLKRAFKFNTKTRKHIESVIRKELKTFDKPSYGGIEKAREIAFDPLHPQMTHVSNDGRHWVDEAFAHIPEIQCQIESMIRIDDLRTAIAEHDSREFKVGDLVVITRKVWGKEPPSEVCEIYAIRAERQTPFHIVNSKADISIGFDTSDAFRHATPSEIKAGHRIDDTIDHITDIRNHVSPSTRVVDL